MDISRANEDGSFTLVHKTEVCKHIFVVIFLKILANLEFGRLQCMDGKHDIQKILFWVAFGWVRGTCFLN